jgi:hypothetical protein
MARIIMDERKRREIDPTVGLLRDCLKGLEGKGTAEAEKRDRLKSMLEFVEMVTSLYTQISALPTGAVRGLFAAKGKIRSLLNLGSEAV